ncbi:MAG: hypothetical protein JRI49_02080, partial [Deltaproteobacteria bacterium]|nr:hypothetical protein [Deltaproteobacteria bacterium]
MTLKNRLPDTITIHEITVYSSDNVPGLPTTYRNDSWIYDITLEPDRSGYLDSNQTGLNLGDQGPLIGGSDYSLDIGIKYTSGSTLNKTEYGTLTGTVDDCVDCSYGQSCFEGICQVICTDSDGGINYYEWGQVRANSGASGESCTSGIMHEYYCEDNERAQTDFTCPYGCGYGKCKECTQSAHCGDHASCSSETCICDNNWGNCDEDWANGCERDLRVELENCGECGNVCEGANQCENDACNNGACVIYSKPTTTYCDDGDPCTENDRCDGVGGCDGQEIACGVGETCTDGVCLSDSGCISDDECGGSTKESYCVGDNESCTHSITHVCMNDQCEEVEKTNCNYCPYGCVDNLCRVADCEDGDERPCGQCGEGVRTCYNGAWGSSCIGDRLPSDEVCDGIDNDCDDEVDENDVCDGGYCGNGFCEYVSVAMCEGGEKTFSLDGNYTLKLIGISDETNAVISLDGVSKSTYVGNSYIISGVPLYIQDTWTNNIAVKAAVGPDPFFYYEPTIDNGSAYVSGDSMPVVSGGVDLYPEGFFGHDEHPWGGIKKPLTLTSSDLPVILANGTFSDDTDSSYDYIQSIEIGERPIVYSNSSNDLSSLTPIWDIGTDYRDPLYTKRVNFANPLNGSNRKVQGNIIDLFGKE